MDQLNLTQHIVEDIIQPKLIIVKNKESAAYWGRDHSIGVWMGYKFDFVESFNCGELFKISGLINSKERIAPEIINTNLNNTLVLFTGHINQYTRRDKKPTPSLIKSLYERSLSH